MSHPASSSSTSKSVPNIGVGVTAMKLDVTKISKGGAEVSGASDNQIALLLELPDGKTEVRKYRPDLTVGYVKVELAKAHGIPFDCQELELNGKPMADPFSLSDYPLLKVSRASNPVRVLVKRVVPSDGEGDENELVAEGGATGKGEEATSDYDDESFED